jgi:ribonuclease J
VVENGQVVEFDGQTARLGERVIGGHVLIDGTGIGDVGDVVLRDRRLLSHDGFVVVVVALDEATGELIEGPDIVSRGFVYMRDAEDLIEEAKQVVINCCLMGRDTARSLIHDTLAEFLYANRRRPISLPGGTGSLSIGKWALSLQALLDAWRNNPDVASNVAAGEPFPCARRGLGHFQ